MTINAYILVYLLSNVKLTFYIMRIKQAIYALTALFCFNVDSLFSQWQEVLTIGSVPHLKNHSAIYHPGLNSMFVFGGRTASGISNELWKFDIQAGVWSLVTPSGNLPSARYTQNAHYDSLNNRMLIWSGQAQTAVLNDIWAYDFASNSWLELWPDSMISGAPLQRYGTGSVFDPVNKRLITFAGFTTAGRFDDTWFFHTDTHEWFDRTNSIHPPKRCLHSAVFARDQRKMIVYAGQDTGPLEDIWQLNIDDFMWQNITPQVNPPGRFWNSTVYTPHGGGSLIIHGGLDAGARGDMWKFSFQTGGWEQIDQGVSKPAARWGHTAIYVPQLNRMIVFGGEGDTLYNDTWQYNNAGAIGIQQISQNIPNNFSLEQNYPNPFNPATNFKFNIAETGLVNIAVYDALGRKIGVLVNSSLKPGTYEISWDASSYPSGVYFYSLVTLDFQQTKRMILIK